MGFLLGPNSRPSNEEETTSPAATTSADEPSTGDSQPSATPNRNLQNFFMQRMSDILTQLVTRSTSDENEGERTTSTTTETNPEPTPPAPPTETETTPIVQMPPTPPPASSPESTATNEQTEDQETTTESNRPVRRRSMFTENDMDSCLETGTFRYFIRRRSTSRQSE